MASVVINGDTSGSVTLQAPSVAGTNTLSLPANTGTAILDYSTPAYRNRIINGAMVIDQRNAGSSVTPANGAYTLDRWQIAASQASKLSIQQVTTAPTGFGYSAKVTSLSAYAVGASEAFRLQQSIEGFNIVDLAWGTASAQAATLSFRVYSSLTGTFGGSISDSVANYSFPFSYTISAANTWTTITVSILGPTSGTWGTSNGIGLVVIFSLGAGATVSGTAGSWTAGFYASATGATSVVGTNGATFYITGVQLEKGSTATTFDWRPYGTELALCQRYYWKYVSGNQSAVGMATQYDATTVYVVVPFPVTMRSAPTSACSSGSGYYNFVRAGANDLFNSMTLTGYTSNSAAEIYNNTEISGTAGQSGWIRTSDANSFIAFTAEL